LIASELALRMSFGSESEPRRSESRHTERSLGCLSACPRHRDAEHRWTAETAASLGSVWEFVDIRQNGSRPSLVRDDGYFVLDALLDRQPVETLVVVWLALTSRLFVDRRQIRPHALPPGRLFNNNRRLSICELGGTVCVYWYITFTKFAGILV